MIRIRAAIVFLSLLFVSFLIAFFLTETYTVVENDTALADGSYAITLELAPTKVPLKKLPFTLLLKFRNQGSASLTNFSLNTYYFKFINPLKLTHRFTAHWPEYIHPIALGPGAQDLQFKRVVIYKLRQKSIGEFFALAGKIFQALIKIVLYPSGLFLLGLLLAKRGLSWRKPPGISPLQCLGLGLIVFLVFEMILTYSGLHFPAIGKLFGWIFCLIGIFLLLSKLEKTDLTISPPLASWTIIVVAGIFLISLIVALGKYFQNESWSLTPWLSHFPRFPLSIQNQKSSWVRVWSEQEFFILEPPIFNLLLGALLYTQITSTLLKQKSAWICVSFYLMFQIAQWEGVSLDPYFLYAGLTAIQYARTFSS